MRLKCALKFNFKPHLIMVLKVLEVQTYIMQMAHSTIYILRLTNKSLKLLKVLAATLSYFKLWLKVLKMGIFSSETCVFLIPCVPHMHACMFQSL